LFVFRRCQYAAFTLLLVQVSRPCLVCCNYCTRSFMWNVRGELRHEQSFLSFLFNVTSVRDTIEHFTNNYRDNMIFTFLFTRQSAVKNSDEFFDRRVRIRAHLVYFIHTLCAKNHPCSFPGHDCFKMYQHCVRFLFVTQINVRLIYFIKRPAFIRQSNRL